MINGLMVSYVNAINEGAVPNIENAWTYICRSQCRGGFEKNFDEYEEGISDTLKQGWPVSSHLLKSMHKDLKAIAINNYKRSAVGDSAEEYKEELVARIMEKYNNLKIENKKEFETILVQSMVSVYKPIDKKVTSMEYRNFYDYETDLRSFQAKFMETEPHGPNKELLIVEFVWRGFQKATYAFIGGLQKSNHEQLTAIQHAREQLDKELLALKDEKLKVKNDLLNRISDLEGEKSELTVKYQCVSENLTEIKHQKDIMEEQFKTQLHQDKETAKTEIGTLKEDLSEGEARVSEVEGNLLIKQSEFDKEKALMEAKIRFYEESMESFNRKEVGYNDEVRQVRDELMATIRENTQKYEDNTSSLEREIQMLNERLNENEEENYSKDEKLEEFSEALEKKERKWKELEESLSERLLLAAKELEDMTAQGQMALSEENQS